MKHEVFILGGQTIDTEEQEGMAERLGEMRKGRRERIEKESREGMEKETKTQGLRDPPLLENLDPTPRCSYCFFKTSGYDKLELKHKNLVFTSL